MLFYNLKELSPISFPLLSLQLRGCPPIRQWRERFWLRGGGMWTPLLVRRTWEAPVSGCHYVLRGWPRGDLWSWECTRPVTMVSRSTVTVPGLLASGETWRILNLSETKRREAGIVWEVVERSSGENWRWVTLERQCHPKVSGVR